MVKGLVTVAGAALLMLSACTSSESESEEIQAFSPAAYEVLQEAERHTGTPYEFGGDATEAFDCSGFVQHVFEENGVDLPRVSRDQAQEGMFVTRDNLQPGDVVFYQNTWREGVSHNGIYIGNNHMIHASRSEGVTVISMDDDFWEPKYHSARRILPEGSGIALDAAEPTAFLLQRTLTRLYAEQQRSETDA
ncbi:C40 family peptidase [Alkalicoccus urumqiensis]|uniref:Hydrolase n=1 Tax=Alkalicoccus urumqiensis TaxID=1548213 RepID=A0A2P6MHR7_ALKUR|nr:C40 family peptidase [Alkalicoccus urumqiensis]PRO65788.1 hydrolase [Alkalicoccus urumqiensis]